MLNKWNPLTTATSVGVAVRYFSAMLGMVLTVVGLLGWLTPEQVADLREMMPDVTAAVGVIISAAVTTYAIVTKSSSDKAAEVAKQVDDKVPKESPVEIRTPAGVPDIRVPGASGGLY